MQYRNDERSSIHRLRHKTREHYDGLLRRIVTKHGSVRLSSLNEETIQALYEDWSEDGAKIAAGYSFITMLRTVVNFGATTLLDSDCERVSAALRRMKFENSKPRTAQLSEAQAIAIRAKANELGWHSVALAQAIQFDCRLGQRDVIGEWVPISEPGSSDIIAENHKWLRGLRWSEIDENLVLRHVTSRQQEEFTFDLHGAPMVMEELKRPSSRPRSGPVIVCESSNLPWTTITFRRRWRLIARAVGVPDEVQNRDTGGGSVMRHAEDERMRRLHRRKQK
jgi:hypothetical protein